VETGKCLQTLEGHGYRVNSVVFSHNSKQLASASWDNLVKIWDAETRKCLQTLEGHGHAVLSVVFSHDSKWLASASWDKMVKIWDVETGKCLQTLEGHHDMVNSVVFSHDSKQLASASLDETVKIWDAETGKCLQTLVNGFFISSLSFDPTGSHLITDRGTIALGEASFVRRISRVSSCTPIIDDNVSVLDDVVGLHEPQWCSYGLSPDRAWITWHGKNLLWLPSEYRPGAFAMSRATVGIGCGNGRIVVIWLSPTGPGSKSPTASERRAPLLEMVCMLR